MIAQLKANAELSKQAAAIHENTIKEQYELKLKTAQEQVEIKELSFTMPGSKFQSHRN